MTRTKLIHRTLPSYTIGEEIMNMVTHIVGGALGIAVLLLSLFKAVGTTAWDMVGVSIYGASMIALYCVSSVYHGLRTNMSKKVMQVIDHCTIYFLIAGTYTPILVSAMIPAYPLVGWGLLIAEWGMAALAITLTAIDLKKYNAFSMVCYIGMGWGIILFLDKAMDVMTQDGFYLLLWGGIVYTIGAILYAIGSKRSWFHAIFHIFVVLGSLLQFLAIYMYVL